MRQIKNQKSKILLTTACARVQKAGDCDLEEDEVNEVNETDWQPRLTLGPCCNTHTQKQIGLSFFFPSTFNIRCIPILEDSVALSSVMSPANLDLVNKYWLVRHGRSVANEQDVIVSTMVSRPRAQVLPDLELEVGFSPLPMRIPLQPSCLLRCRPTAS
jgi:hypothetical protein